MHKLVRQKAPFTRSARNHLHLIDPGADHHQPSYTTRMDQQPDFAKVPSMTPYDKHRDQRSTENRSSIQDDADFQVKLVKQLIIEVRSPGSSIRRKPLPKDSPYSPTNSPRNSTFPIFNPPSVAVDTLPSPHIAETQLLQSTPTPFQKPSDSYTSIPLGSVSGSQIGVISKNGYKVLHGDIENAEEGYVKRGKWSRGWTGRKGWFVTGLVAFIVIIIVVVPAMVGLSRFQGVASE